MTALVMAAFLMLLGIYNSAILVSANNILRKSIYKISIVDPISSMPIERMSIGQLVNNTLETIDISNSAQKASRKMRDKNISSLDTK